MATSRTESGETIAQEPAGVQENVGVQEPAPVQRVVFHDDYELAILMEPNGRLRKVLHVRGVDGADFEALGRMDVVENARAAVDGDARATEWEERLHALRTTMQPIRYRTGPPGAAPGQPETVYCLATPIPNADGTLNSILLQTEDRTTALRVEKELQASEERFRALAESLPPMVWVADANGSVSYFSPQWERFSGRSQQELLGEGFRDLVHPDDLDLMRTQRDAEGEFRAVTFRMRRADGEYRWVEADYRVIYGRDGALLRLVGATTDITDRRNAEQLSQEQQEQLRAALEVTGLGRYSLYFREDRITGDDRLSEILGTDVPELMRAHGLNGLFAMVHLDDVARVQHAVETAAAGGPDYDVEYRMWRPTGDGDSPTELRWVAARGRVEFDDEGAFRMVGVVEDITERRREQETRLRWQKREAIGTLAAGVAHDFNNVISAILSNAALADRELSVGHSPVTSVAEIRRGAERAAEIVQRLLAFSREEREEELIRAPFDVGGVVQEACALVSSFLPSDATLRCTVGPDLPPVLGAGAEMHRVVVNLLTNAGYAVDGRAGTVTVSVERVDAPPDTPAAPPEVRISVEDTGPGIPEPVFTRIFDPFFTTKPTGKGTGLGLAAAQTIVRNHGGRLDAENLPDGGGARFTVLLPTVEHAVSAEPSAGAGAMLAGARVIFVDDEAPLVLLAERALPTYGHTVRAFRDPIAALDAVAADPSAVDALVTDLSMPGMSGLNLIARVRELRPDLPVVLSSGFLTTANRQEAERQGVDAIVPKPCSIDDLATALSSILAPG